MSFDFLGGNMKKLFDDILSGIVLFIFIFTAEFFIMFLIEDPALLANNQMALIDLEFLLISLPAGILSFILAICLKTTTLPDILQKGVVWAGEIACFYLAIGLLNNTTARIFGTFGIYLTLALIFVGPLFAGMLKSRRRAPLTAKE